MAKQKSPEIKKKPDKLRKASPNVLYWFVFVMAIIAWGGIFYVKFSEFAEFADDLENRMAEDREVLWTVSGEDVLGVDDLSEDGEVLADAEAEAAEEEDGSEVDNLVDEIEEERKENLRTVLTLQLPDETDNPNYPVTFTEPTEEGVNIQIDGDGFAKKKSPYLLPSLAIGKHTLHFKFNDEDEVSQNLEETVIVIPRPPKIAEDQKLEFRSDEKIEFCGTALPHSKVVFLVSSEILTTIVDVDSEGEWTVVIKDELSKGSHSAVSFVRKDGYAGNFSEPVNFSVGVVAGEASTNGIGDFDNGVSFDFDSLFGEDNIYYTLAGFSAVSFILILFSAFLGRRAGRKNAEPILVETDIAPGGKKISLRDKFAGVGVAVKGKMAKAEEPKAKAPAPDKQKSTSSDGDDNVEDEKPLEPEGPETSSGKLLKKKPSRRKAKPEKPKEAKKTKKVKEKASPSKDKDDSSSKSGKVYSKDDFLEKFGGAVDEGKDSNKISITLTSKTDKDK